MAKNEHSRYHAAMKSVPILSVLICLLAGPTLAQEQGQAARCGELPAAVAATKQAIAAAAETGDFDALARLTDPETFTYSFGDGGDPAGHWKAMKAEGTDAAAIMLKLFDMPCSVFTISGDATYYSWPSAAELPYADLTADEVAALQRLYDGKLEDWYLEGTATGYYVGWRLLITGDGKWNAFVAGD
jgi:hypothetical protein